MAQAEQTELEAYKEALAELEKDALPIVQEISKETRKARKAMDQDPVDTLTLSNKLVELSILNQRLGERVATMGYIVRGCKEFYERIREGHKVRLTQKGEPRQTTETDAKGKEKIVTKYVTMPAGVADSMKIELAHTEFEIYNECEKVMDQLVYARKSTDKTIDSIRSKLSYEKTNERNAV